MERQKIQPWFPEENQNRESEGGRRKLKQKEELRKMLTDSEFTTKGTCAIRLLLAKLDIINAIWKRTLNRDVIQNTTGRIKGYESTLKKLKKKELEPDCGIALEKIHDLLGVRGICSYVDDIYEVADLIRKQEDFHILKEKDYIKNPKKSGYQSLHLILEVPVTLQEETQWMKVELQLRTAAMDYWANLDHELRYKKTEKEIGEVDEALRQCADVIRTLDLRMLEIRKKIASM